MEDLNDLKDDIKDLGRRLQAAETSIQVAEATRSERHQNMIDRFERVEQRLNMLEEQLTRDMNILYNKIDLLQELATQGKTSLKTMWVVGGLVTAALGLLASWLQVFK
jgi:predicted  nucleic acid-binding Zn-ribbon protein